MNLVVAMTGASGSLATKLLVEKSQWPVTLVASKMGRFVYEQEAGPFAELEAMAANAIGRFVVLASERVQERPTETGKLHDLLMP